MRHALGGDLVTTASSQRRLDKSLLKQHVVATGIALCVDAYADLTMCRNSNDQNRSCAELGYTAISSPRSWSRISRQAGQNRSDAYTVRLFARQIRKFHRFAESHVRLPVRNAKRLEDPINKASSIFDCVFAHNGPLLETRSCGRRNAIFELELTGKLVQKFSRFF